MFLIWNASLQTLGFFLCLSALTLATGCRSSSSATVPDAGVVTYPPPTKLTGMTWYKDVLPIAQDHCQGCHISGGIGPFPLVTYSDAQAVYAAMSSAVQ